MADSDELTRFVREALRAGRSRDDIAGTLRAAGWPADQIDPALKAFADIDYPVPVPRPRPYLSAKEAFWYLVLFTTLYLWAFFLGALLFDLIEAALPDPTDPAYASRYRAEGMRWAIAAIVVAFPVYLFMTRLIGRALHQEPDKRASRVRKWLTYLTLFVTVCILVGDLTALIYNLLSGDLTLRFTLKVLVVAVLAGGILGYYLADLRRDETEGDAEPRSWSRGLAIAATVVVVASISAGFAVIGSPASAREAELDERRIEDLRAIESAVRQHWYQQESLPARLDQVAALQRSGDRLTDPLTGEPYAYTVLTDSTYELCATFATTNFDRYVGPGEIGHHDIGQDCFKIEAPR